MILVIVLVFPCVGCYYFLLFHFHLLEANNCALQKHQFRTILVRKRPHIPCFVIKMLNSYTSVVNLETIVIQVLILLVSSYGIIKPIFVIAQGYGLSIFVFGSTLIILLLRYAITNRMSFPVIVLMAQSFMLVAYGFRLAYYIGMRNKKDAYIKNRQGSFNKPVSFLLTIPLWVLVSFLYLCYGLPVLIGYRALIGGYRLNSVLHLVGTLIMLAGLVIEAVADSQKSQSKLEKPNRFCDCGVYHYCRMPNYFGELIFWTGCSLSCIGDEMSAIQIGFCLFGIVCAYYIMLHSASSLDKSQFERYHGDSEYMKYRCEVPVLFPFTHWYSMFKVEKMDYTLCL